MEKISRKQLDERQEKLINIKINKNKDIDK